MKTCDAICQHGGRACAGCERGRRLALHVVTSAGAFRYDLDETVTLAVIDSRRESFLASTLGRTDCIRWHGASLVTRAGRVRRILSVRVEEVANTR